MRAGYQVPSTHEMRMNVGVYVYMGSGLSNLEHVRILVWEDEHLSIYPLS